MIAPKPCPMCGAKGEAHRNVELPTSYFAGCSDPDCIAHQLAFDFVSEETAIAAWNTRAEGPAPVSARRSPADQDQQLVDQMRAAHARVWTEQGWRSEQSLRDGYEVWTLDSTGQRRIILARGCTPNVAALMCIVSTGLTRLCDLADAPVSAPLDLEGVEGPLVAMLSEAVRFASWAAGEGICPVEGQPARAPEDFLMEYSDATGEEEWETMADRLPAILALSQQDQVGLTTPAVLGGEDIDGLPSQSCADGSLPVLTLPLHSDGEQDA